MVIITTTSDDGTPRPSEGRRKQLGLQIKAPNVSNFFPIERYYDAAETLYSELQQISRLVQAQPEASISYSDITNFDASSSSSSSFDWTYDIAFNAGLDMTYLYAKRYYTLCFDAIPKHHYYNTIKYQHLKQKHAMQMTKVLRLLEHVVDQMDVQELILRLLQEQKEKEEQSRLLERHRLLQESSSSLKSVGNDSNQGPLSVQQSALEKLKMLMPPSTTPTLPDEATSKPNRTSTGSSSTRYRLDDDDDDDDDDIDTNGGSIPNHAVSLDGMKPLLPPTTLLNHHQNDNVVPLLPPPTPPSYEAVVNAMQNRIRPHSESDPQHRDTSYIRPPPLPPPEQPKRKKEKIQPQLPMRQQQENYKARYMKYQQSGQILISSIDTYQGRLSESTNGCTVISALIVARHMQDTQPYTAISNTAVKNVIDVQCGPILRTIRRKLGLGGHALIIPSDVHDYLVDEKILLQEQFTGAAGGNIMNEQHYREFLQLLADTTATTSNGSSNPTTIKKSNGKAGATLFFREHVISIVKSIDPNTKESYYDLIDSMPGMLHNGKSMATRTRCTNMESLEALLLWYASRKFSDANCTYIDRNPWDDNTADLDPRVFQGFVWSS